MREEESVGLKTFEDNKTCLFKKILLNVSIFVNIRKYIPRPPEEFSEFPTMCVHSYMSVSV